MRIKTNCNGYLSAKCNCSKMQFKRFSKEYTEKKSPLKYYAISHILQNSAKFETNRKYITKCKRVLI